MQSLDIRHKEKRWIVSFNADIGKLAKVIFHKL